MEECRDDEGGKRRGCLDCGVGGGKVQRYIMMERTIDVCGVRRVGGQGRKGSEWWNEEVSVAVAGKRRVFEKRLPRRDMVAYDRYRKQRAVVKKAVTVAERMADWCWES